MVSVIEDTNTDKLFIDEVRRSKLLHDVFLTAFVLKRAIYDEISDISYERIVCVLAV